jgi:hypothetical protein
MVVWVVAIVISLVTAASTKLAIAIHFLTYESVYQTKQLCYRSYKEHTRNVWIPEAFVFGLLS